MKVPVQQIHEASSKMPPILIVDKIGLIGEELAKEFSQDYLVVLVSPKRFSQKNGKVMHVAFKRRIPQVPDGRYSKIFIVDDGEKITRKSAFSFIEKAREVGATFYFIGSVRNTDVKHADEIAASYSKSQVLIFGDLFDKNIFFDKTASISKFSLQARKNERIMVENDGLMLSYPVTFKDTIKLIIKASYLDISQKTILLFSPHPITDISLASKFKNINPDIKIDFINSKRKSEFYIPKNSQFALSKYNLGEKIKELEIEKKENREVRVIDKSKKRKNFIKPALAFSLLILFILLLPFLTTGAYIKLGEREIENAFASADNGNFDKARRQVKSSSVLFDIALKTSQPLLLEGKYLGMKKPAESIKKKAETGKTISNAGLGILDGGELLRNVYDGKSMDPKSDFINASNLFRNAVLLVQKVKAEGNLPKNLESDYNSVLPFIDLFSNSSEILPDILGFDSPKKYLILLQDNSELRPGGGVVEAFAVMEIKNAKITDFTAFDEAPVDENLKSIIEPAFGLKRYLLLENLTLRDSNFDPDFINSAISASNIYSLAVEEKVDGVIAIDAIFIKNMLNVLGPIAVPGQSEKISDKNIEKISFRENNFGIEILNSLKNELDTRNDLSPFLITRQIGNLISEKHLLFAFPNPSTQNIFTANGWSSSLWDNREKENNKINDYLGVSEGNLGKNKINKFVSRSISKKVSVSDSGKISSELSISFKNNAEKGNGVYKNYLQLVLPEASRLTSISIDGKREKVEKAITNAAQYNGANFKPPVGLEVYERNQMDKNVYGFLVQVAEKEIKTIVVNYDIPYSLPSSQKSAVYSLKIYKQPGIDSYPFDLSFNLPSSQTVLNFDKSLSREIRKDEEFLLTIAQR